MIFLYWYSSPRIKITYWFIHKKSAFFNAKNLSYAPKNYFWSVRDKCIIGFFFAKSNFWNASFHKIIHKVCWSVNVFNHKTHINSLISYQHRNYRHNNDFYYNHYTSNYHQHLWFRVPFCIFKWRLLLQNQSRTLVWRKHFRSCIWLLWWQRV